MVRDMIPSPGHSIVSVGCGYDQASFSTLHRNRASRSPKVRHEGSGLCCSADMAIGFPGEWRGVMVRAGVRVRAGARARREIWG